MKSLSDAGIDYKSCLDPAFIIQNDNDPATGYGYAGIMNMIGYQCGAGLYRKFQKTDQKWFIFSCFDTMGLHQEHLQRQKRYIAQLFDKFAS